MPPPFRHDKVNLSDLPPDKRRELLYPSAGKPPFPGKLGKLRGKLEQRKYFDSGDYALSKAGRAPQSTVGTAIPNPENIPHASSPGNGHNNGHQVFSISPTNSTSTSPANKESRLATEVPDSEGTVKEVVPDEPQSAPCETVNPILSLLLPPASGESVVQYPAAVADSNLNTEAT